MGYPPIENLLPKTGHSIYTLVRLAANRATQLAEGSAPLIDMPSTTKTATLALEEICAGKVVHTSVADQFVPEEETPAKTEEEEI